MQCILPYAYPCILIHRKYMAANEPGGHHNGTAIRPHDCRLLIQSQLEMDILGVRHGVCGVLRPSPVLAGDICAYDPGQTSAETAEGDERCKHFRTHRAGEEGWKQIIMVFLARPIRMMFTESLVTFTCVYLAFETGIYCKSWQIVSFSSH